MIYVNLSKEMQQYINNSNQRAVQSRLNRQNVRPLKFPGLLLQLTWHDTPQQRRIAYGKLLGKLINRDGYPTRLAFKRGLVNIMFDCLPDPRISRNLTDRQIKAICPFLNKYPKRSATAQSGGRWLINKRVLQDLYRRIAKGIRIPIRNERSHNQQAYWYPNRKYQQYYLKLLNKIKK